MKMRKDGLWHEEVNFEVFGGSNYNYISNKNGMSWEISERSS